MMTVKELRAKLENAPDDARVIVCREGVAYAVDAEFTGMGPHVSGEPQFWIDADEPAE